MSDVMVIGGGVIGLSVAYELAGQGVSVTVVDQGALGQEASWAGAGILPPGNPTVSLTPEQRLRSLSYSLWPLLSEELKATTGIDNGFVRCGGWEVRLSGSPDQLAEEVAAWRAEGVQVTESTPKELFAREPNVNPQAVAGYRLPELAQVRNPRHVKALIAGCAARGVKLNPGTPVLGFDRQAEKIVGAKTAGKTLFAGSFCLCAGAWSAGLAELVKLKIPVRPVRGQIVQLVSQPLPFTHVLQSGSRYLVPRPDGRILVGSTEEEAGFEKRNTTQGVAGLLEFATRLVPDLAEATVARCWAGLRPGSPDGLPYLGRVPAAENLYVAAGHFRSGLQMSPGTGLILRQLLLDQPVSIPMEGLHSNRHQQMMTAQPPVPQ